jgi:hypothetical protein
MANKQINRTLKTYRATVEIEFQGLAEYNKHEVFGPQIVAERFAEMAINYASIGATKSRVLDIKELD